MLNLLRSVWRRVLPARVRRDLHMQLARVRASYKALFFRPSQISVAKPQAIDIICFPIINWEFRFQRPQQLLGQFAHRGHRVFYLQASFTGLKQQAIQMTGLGERIYGLALPGDPTLSLYQDYLVDPTLTRARIALQEFIRQYGIPEAVLLVQFPFWKPLAEALKAQYDWKLIYDCMDDHGGFQATSSTIAAREMELVKASDLVVTTSHVLYERQNRLNPNCALIPNAGDYAHFNALPTRASSPIADLPRPVIGYYGAIAEWFDVEAVRCAAVRHPEWSFVLIGHTFGADLGRLSKLYNIYVLGEKLYEELPRYVTSFDICTIPFLRTALTEATNPVKVFEYLSTGKPVVATALPELEALAGVVYQYTQSEEFVTCLEQVLSNELPDAVDRRREIARQNTWEMRYQSLNSRMELLYGQASIIVVTWNNLEYTQRCIESVLGDRTWPNYNVIVVDNASTDGTVEYLQKISDQDPRVKMILNSQNLGFAAANNIGLRQANEADFVVFLNNDTVVPRGWLCRLLRYARQPEIGMVGPVTNWAGNEAKIDVNYVNVEDMGNFAGQYISAHEGQVFDINSLAMYCVAMRMSVIDQVGLLDERFGQGMFEDDDYGRRVRQAGYRVICAEDAFVHHYGMVSFAKLDETRYRELFERNKQLYEEKWGQPWVPHSYRAKTS